MFFFKAYLYLFSLCNFFSNASKSYKNLTNFYLEVLTILIMAINVYIVTCFFNLPEKGVCGIGSTGSISGVGSKARFVVPYLKKSNEKIEKNKFKYYRVFQR